MQRLINPFPLWLDQAGALLDAGRIFIGDANDDPELSPTAVFWDVALTIPAAQPLRTRGGVIVNNGSPAIVYIAAADYSVRVRDADSNLVSYVPSAVAAAAAYQPLDADLTAIAAVGTTPFGRALLAMADAVALLAALAIPDALPLAGGTVTGNILRQAAGPHLFHDDPAMTSGRVFVTAVGDPDPTADPGDIWLKF